MKKETIAFVCSFLIMKCIYAQNTFPATGNVGVGTAYPRAVLDVGKYINNGTLGTALARQLEGDAVAEGTYLGVKAWGTQDKDYSGKSFSLDHYFYGELNSSINFYRGGARQGGYITFATYNGTERMRIGANGNVNIDGSVGIGTSNPGYKLDVSDGLRVGAKNPGGAMLAIADDAIFYDDQNSNLRLRMIYGGALQIDNGGLTTTGKVGIGTINPQSELAVKGTITSMRVKVSQAGWPDYVFDSSYQLTSLPQVELFIQQNKHLPEVPSAAEVKKDGLDLGDSQALLLKKIEELTLYIIQQNKQIIQQGQQLSKQNEQISQQCKDMQEMKREMEVMKVSLQNSDR